MAYADKENSEDVVKVLTYLEAVEKAKHSTDEVEVIHLIEEHRLEREQILTNHLKSKEVCHWKYLWLICLFVNCRCSCLDWLLIQFKPWLSYLLQLYYTLDFHLFIWGQYKKCVLTAGNYLDCFILSVVLESIDNYCILVGCRYGELCWKTCHWLHYSGIWERWPLTRSLPQEVQMLQQFVRGFGMKLLWKR